MCLSHGIFGKPAPPEPATTRQPCPPDSLQTASDSSKSSQESFPSSMPTWSQINLLPAAGPCSYRTVATEAVGCRLPILRKEVLTLRVCSPVETCSISPETPDALHPPVRRAGSVIAGCSNLCGCSWSGTCRLIIFIAARNLLALQQGGARSPSQHRCPPREDSFQTTSYAQDYASGLCLRSKKSRSLLWHRNKERKSQTLKVLCDSQTHFLPTPEDIRAG